MLDSHLQVVSFFQRLENFRGSSAGRGGFFLAPLGLRTSENQVEMKTSNKSTGTTWSWCFFSHVLVIKNCLDYLLAVSCFQGMPCHIYNHLEVSYLYTIVKVDGATPERWRFVRGHDKPIHGSCAIIFSGGIHLHPSIHSWGGGTKTTITTESSFLRNQPTRRSRKQGDLFGVIVTSSVLPLGSSGDRSIQKHRKMKLSYSR